MNDLEEIKIGDWLMIVSTVKGSSFILQQVTSTTRGLVGTLNYTFRRDGRSFSLKQKSLTAHPATTSEIEQWGAGRRKLETEKQEEPSEEVVLARYLKSVTEEEWAKLGVAQLKKIRAELEKCSKLTMSEETGTRTVLTSPRKDARHAKNEPFDDSVTSASD